MDCDAQVQANAMRLELNLMIEAEVERVEHAAMMAAAWNQPAYLGLAHPDPVSLKRRRTARYLSADLGSGGNSRWRGDWSRSRVWEHLTETAVLTDGEKEFQNLCRLPREIFDEIVEAAVRSGKFAAPTWESVLGIPTRSGAFACHRGTVRGTVRSFRSRSCSFNAENCTSL